MFNKKTIFFAIILITAAVSTAAVCYMLWFLEDVKQKPVVVLPTVIQEKQYIQLLFVGDLMFDRGIRYYANQGGSNKFIFDKIHKTLANNDLVIANLEGPITGNKSVSSGTIPGSTNNYYFTFDPSWAKTLADENIKLVSLGNNHILNFGRKGLESTKNYLAEAGVDYFGSPDYPKSVTSKINGINIAFINYNEFSAVPTEAEGTVEEIQKAKGFSDIIILYCHWGSEYQLTASDSKIDLAHQFVDAGADLVIGSHPHVIQQSEEYNGKKIYYSLGNFVFDQYFSEDVRKGLGVEVKINKNTKQLEFKELNFYLDSNGQTIIKDIDKINKK